MIKQEATTNWKIGESQAALPPKVPGLPILGSGLAMRQDPARFIVECYQQYGPIFRIQLPNKEVTVLAGLEANKFTTQNDEAVFTNEIEFAGLRQEAGPFFTALPPEEHQYMRRLMKPAYSRLAALQQVPLLVEIVDELLAHLEPGQSFEVFPTLQELVVTQLGAMLLDQRPGEYFEDFRTFMRTMLEVHTFGLKPKLFLKLPTYQRAKARSFEMSRKVLEHNLAAHKLEEPGAGKRPRNGIDILLGAQDPHGQPFDEAHLLAEALGPYLAGQDTVAGTLTFICYTAHKYPQVRERIEAEARAGFAQGIPATEAWRSFDTLHKTIQETMRRYPVAPFMPRHARNEFEFAGYRVPAGSAVYCATSVTHFLPEYYPDPYTFDIERPSGPAGSFVPYGVGNYACLGAGIADVQLLVSMAALMRGAHFELEPPDYEAKLSTIPLPNPGRFRLRMVEKFV